MSQRIRFGLGLMVICILGIILTQGYWLYKDYNYYRGQPLFSTNYDFYLKTVATTNLDPVSISRGSIMPRMYPAVSATAAPLEPASTLSSDTSGLPVLIAFPAQGAVRSPELTISAIPSNVATAPRIVTKMAPLVAPADAEDPTFYKTTAYEAPISHILQKMKWQFGGSVLLILFTTSGFVYMLVTIFMQRKLSFVKNEFINNMTHELKTPLATVSVAIEAMRNFGVLDDKVKTGLYLDISKKELDHLSKMIEMIMQLSVYESYKMDLVKKMINPESLITEVVEKYKLSEENLVINLNNSFFDPKQYVDPIHISNALRNLVDNSIKYSEKPVHITINSRFEEGCWVLSVKDNGPGIAKKYQKDVFERFFRIQNEDKPLIKGFGLGLSYVKQVVELHQGTIVLYSTEGEGSNFTITLPFNLPA